MTATPPRVHQSASKGRPSPKRSTRCPTASAPTKEAICSKAPKPKLDAKVSPRCIITVGIHPDSPKMQNRLRNAATQIAIVVRRYLGRSSAAIEFPEVLGSDTAIVASL